MPDLEQKNQNDFMVEKIKVKPVNKKKLIRRTLITISMAIIFGMVACITFLVLEPVFSNWLNPEEEPQVETWMAIKNCTVPLAGMRRACGVIW